MLRAAKQNLAALLAAVALMSQIPIGKAYAQAVTYQQRLSTMQLQIAYQQQQTAVQLALQQTNLLLQTAFRENSAPEPSRFYRPLNVQQQQSALQRALKQTAALQQAMMRSNNGPGQTEFLQINAMRTALLASSLQTASQIQNDQLTTTQIQTLFREQSSLIGLLALPPPQVSSRDILRRFP
jgi:hypothetical protein